MSWVVTLGWVLAETGCLARGCLVSFGFEREDDGELLFCVDHYQPGKAVRYTRFAAGKLVIGEHAERLGREIASDLAIDHAIAEGLARE